MPHPLSSISRNGLLRAHSCRDLERLHPLLEPVSLGVGDVLVEPNEPIGYVHFMEQGIASVVAVSQAERRIEVATIGREGMTGVHVIQDIDRAPYLTFIQVAGSALRMRASDLREVMEKSPSLRNLLLRYAHTLSIQTGHTALANGRFTITKRLARWLLMSHDRLDTNDIPLTHDLLALMLGVRRPGVTTALHILEGEHMIRSARGQVTVRDRSKLERLAGDSYGVPEAEYQRVIGSDIYPRRAPPGRQRTIHPRAASAR